MKILEDSVTVDGHILHRIQADRDIPFHGVKVGDVGGWVENPNNLQDDAWVTGYLYGDAVACDNALIEGMAFDNAFVKGMRLFRKMPRCMVTPILVVTL